MYAFVGIDKQKLPSFDDEQFAMELLEQQHVLVAPGSSFNAPDRDHFRITTLPEEARLAEVFQRVEHVLAANCRSTAQARDGMTKAA